MKKLQRILLPVDFTKVSENAVLYAKQLVEKLSGEILFVYVKTKDDEREDQEIDRKFNALKASLLQDVNFNYKFKILRGSLLSELIKVRALFEADMVIMGSKGKRVSNVSLAATLIRSVYCPVLVVPEGFTNHKIKKIVFANDYRPIKESEAIKPLWEFALEFRSKVYLLHVNHQKEPVLAQNDDAENTLEYYLESLDHEYVYLKNEDMELAINQFIEEKSIDLLAILSRDHGTNQLKSEGRLITELTAHASIPILVLC